MFCVCCALDSGTALSPTALALQEQRSPLHPHVDSDTAHSSGVTVVALTTTPPADYGTAPFTHLSGVTLTPIPRQANIHIINLYLFKEHITLYNYCEQKMNEQSYINLVSGVYIKIIL